MPKSKQHLIAAACLLTAIAFSPVYALENDGKDQGGNHAQHSLDWPGVYFGFLPCADCGGIKTSLALNHNNTYILMTQNVGKSIREFTEKGKFTWTDEKNVMLLTSRDGKVTHRYFVGDNQLVEVDPATGKHSSTHILVRKDVMAKPPKHLH